jgi:two-component system, OmpR family, sensor histidine kinase TctE
MSEAQHKQKSVFGEIVDWTLAPLLILWPISMAIQYFFAYSIANNAYDRELRDSVVAVSKQLAYENGRLKVNVTAANAAILRADEDHQTFFQVRDQRNDVVTGDLTIPVVEFQPELAPSTVYFRDDHIPGYEVRVAYVWAQVPGMPGAVLVQVAETVGNRSRLASEIIGDVLAAQFLIVPIALLFVWLGLTRGIEPLNELTEAIRRRKPSDLSALDENEAPEEVRPLIRSFNDLMGRLDASLRAQERFVADAAHQMRTPLAGLKMQAEIAMRQRDPLGIQHAMRQIVTSADRASHLINQLLALARADADAPPPPLATLDLDVLARETTRDWVARARAKDIDLGFEAAAAPAWIDGNAVLLREALNNLVDNAVAYTRAGGRVTVRVVAGGRPTLEIEDNGIGIDEADRERVFERFFRVLGTEADGSGLGLPIVRGIAQLHRASVAIDPNPRERGTIARMVFPPSEAAPATLRPAA